MRCRFSPVDLWKGRAHWHEIQNGFFSFSAPAQVGNQSCVTVPSNCDRSERTWSNVHYRPQRSCGQGNIFTPVCHSVHRGGVSTRENPPDQADTPLGADTPPDQADTPREQTPSGPGRHPPGPGRHPPDQADPPRPGRHPLGADTPPPGPGRPPPGSRLQHTVNERPVRILLECILVKMNLKLAFNNH